MRKVFILLPLAGLMFFVVGGLHAGSAIWTGENSSVWTDSGNWTGMTFPNGTSDIATFGATTRTAVSIGAGIQVSGITFNTGAASDPYTVTVQPADGITIGGAGITNNSGVDQNFIAATTGSGADGTGKEANIGFTNSASAGDHTVFTIDAASVTNSPGSALGFHNMSDAGSATINNNGATVFSSQANSGTTSFLDTSTAKNAVINNYGGSGNLMLGGVTSFAGAASAGSATINNFAGENNGVGGQTNFNVGSTAGAATINNYGDPSKLTSNPGFTLFDPITPAELTAGSATINNINGGATEFEDSSAGSIVTAGNATINNQGGSTSFENLQGSFGNVNAGNSTINNSGLTTTTGPGTTSFLVGTDALFATINNYGNAIPNTTLAGSTSFSQGASAFLATINNYAGTASQAAGGQTTFTDASAGEATINNYGAAANAGGGGTTYFYKTSNAGAANLNNDAGTDTGALGGSTEFHDTSTADVAKIINNGATTNGARGGSTLFFDNSTAGSAGITNNGATASGAFAGFTQFSNNSTADSATITNNGGTQSFANGGVTTFSDSSDAGSATLIANGGTGGKGVLPNGFAGAILFNDSSTGGTSRVELLGGILDVSGHNASGITIGSIEGGGVAFLGSNNLTVGSNNLNTTFSGAIQDGNKDGGGATGGSLTKIGTGTLVLSGMNTYTGNTSVTGGSLIVDGSIVSPGTSTSNGGLVGGTGTIGGNLTNGSGATSGFVKPGDSPGTLTVNGNFAQGADGTLIIDIAGSSASQISLLKIIGNANLDGTLDPELLNGFIPLIGQQFEFLDYASHSGLFAGIENQTFDNGMEEWQVAYENNDALLSVVASNGSPIGGSPPGVPESGATILFFSVGLLATFGYETCQKRFGRKGTNVSN